MISELMTEIVKQKVSPNQLYLMMAIRDKITTVLINPSMELRILKTDGWVTEEGCLTTQALSLLETIESSFQVKSKKQKKLVLGEDSAEYIAQYRELFPKGMLPSGVPGRVHVRELSTKFTWFFNNYNYTWETILEVTRRYVESYEAANYNYMKNSSYFISKQDKDKGLMSELANRIDQYLEGDEQEQIESTIKIR